MGTNESNIPDDGILESKSSAPAAATAELLAAMQLEIEKLREERDCLREERDIYLEVIYQFRRASRTEEPLPTYEDLVRMSAGPVDFNFMDSLLNPIAADECVISWANDLATEATP